MTWARSTLAEVADFCLGKMLDKKKNKGTPQPYLANANVQWGEVVLDNLREMRFEDHETERFGLKHGDIVMCEGGEPGRCAIWKNQRPGVMFQKAIHRIRPHSCLDNRFLYYTFLHYGKTGQFAPLFTGSTINHLPREKLALLEVAIPPLPVQRRIADILSAYDDLIENNTRRIAILEEMARAIYREWFVEFRFPGHAQAEMADSELGRLPEGWEVRAFSEIAAFQNGFAFKPAHFEESGLPIVKIAELKNGITQKTPFNRGDEIPEKFHITSGDILFSWSAHLDAYVWPHGDGLLNQHLFHVVPDEEYTKLFLYFALKDRMGEFRIRSQGTTMRHIKRSALTEVKVTVPPADLRDQLETHAGPIISHVLNLTAQIRNLRETRDLLLPKLISGEIDVAEAETDLESAAA